MEDSRQVQQTVNEVIHPLLRKPRRQSQRQKARNRLATHGGNIAESADQTAVSDAPGRVPCTTEVHVFYTQVGRNQKLVTFGQVQDGSIVANAAEYTRVCTLPSLAA